jgi:hypothetical protein
MRKLFVAGASVAIYALLVTPAMAGRGGNGNGKGGGASTTTAESSITIEDYRELWLGGTVGFEITTVGLARLGVPDVHRLVLNRTARRRHQHSGRTTAETSCTPRCDRPTSQWLWSGGDAECLAVLYAYGWKGGVESTPPSSRRSASTRKAKTS